MNHTEPIDLDLVHSFVGSRTRTPYTPYTQYPDPPATWQFPRDHHYISIVNYSVSLIRIQA